MPFNFLNQGQTDDAANRVQPIDTFIDPVSKIRVSNPANLIDTDFEYGLQPTKWETVEIINNTPAFFSKSGDTTISDITGITTNGGTREITVTTAFPHLLDVGIPIRVSGTKSVTADGSYIINATPTATTFTYLARANQPETISIFDLYSSIITGEFFQGSQISISDAEGMTTDGVGPNSTITIKTANKHGFGPKTPFYFLNLNSTVSQEFESTNSTSLSFDPSNSATAQSFDGSNTLLQTPVDLSNSATTSEFESNITSTNATNSTVTVSIPSGNQDNWSNLVNGSPLYYDVNIGSGYFQANPRGVVFIKDVSLVDAANGTATFQVSQLPDGDALPILANMTGYFQIADQARTFAGNNVNPETQIDLLLEASQEFVFDGGNQGYDGDATEDFGGNPPDNTSTVVGYTGTNISIFTAEGTIDYYIGAMLKYSTTDTAAEGLINNTTYFVTAFSEGASAGLYNMSIAQFPGDPDINISGGSGTQTFEKIGVSIDKDIVHVRDSNFQEKDMLEYTYPVDGTPGNFGSDFEQKFYFVETVYDEHNYKLREEAGFTPMTASGGDTVFEYEESGVNYKVHIFSSTGSQNFVVTQLGAPGSEQLDYLIVAGGGGGGYQVGGGGGAGGVVAGTLSASAQTYSITIGNGGNGAPNNSTYATNGQNSTAFGLTAIGGGHGGSYNSAVSNAGNGGSGGGGSGSSNGNTSPGTGLQPGSASGGFGNNGGFGRNNNWAGGGGGGANQVGQNSPSNNVGGDGGNGIQSDITGTLTYYAGGGGGCMSGTPNAFAAGGLGGGGRGFGNNGQSFTGQTHGEDGQPNTGGGGGGVRDVYNGSSSYTRSGNGGSGVVILRYRYSDLPLPGIQATGGTISTATSNGIIYQIHKFTSSGSFNVTRIEKPELVNLEYLIVAGGGSGGYQVGGGGGAGGVIAGSLTNLETVNYQINVGDGGSPTPNSTTPAQNGQNSTAFGLTAIGGGKGANHTASLSTAGNGGSGGGGSGNSNSQATPGGTGLQPGSASGGFGNNGGSGRVGWAGGGGGGAGEPGQSSPFTDQGGKGGNGIESGIDGTVKYYGGGGGGCSDGNRTGSDGGLGGGGDGRSNAPYGTTDAEPNTGGGGGGVRDTGNSGRGGSGVIIVRYPIGVEF